jgi:hypothetical protein
MIRRPGFVSAPRRFRICLTIAAVALLASSSTSSVQAAATLTPLATFGGGDGWLAPGEYDNYGYLLNTNLERGLAYGNGHLYLVSREPGSNGGSNIRILDPAIGVDPSTQTDLGGLNIGSGVISGGTFGVNMVGVAGDGAIYVGNLQTNTLAGTNLFKVYKWANESATAPTVAYSGDAGLTGARIGDDFAVIGSGSSTRIVSGFSNTSVSGTNGYAIIDPTAGTATAVSFPSTPPNSGDFRLGITFTDATHVIGAQQPSGITNGFYRYSSFSGSTGTLIASPDLLHSGGATAERQMAYDVINGTPVLAMQSTGDSHVAIYSLADAANPTFLVSGDNALTPQSNPNANGSIAWGPTVNNGDGSFSATLYAMSTNQGIQAFTFTLSPSVTAVAGDYNGNGKVDAADYVLWRNTLGQSVTAGTGADGNADGTITQADYDFWKAKFGNTSGSGSLASANVPEPASIVGCCIAVGAVSMLSRRRTTK